MGCWGTAVFSDDTAADTRDTFTDYVAEGLTAAEATERLMAEFASNLDDSDELCVFWLALAATQSKLGRLIESVRDLALGIIDSGVDLRRWQDCRPAEIAQRKKHLAKLREQLTGPQPKPRKLKPVVKSSTDFRAGDVASFRLDDQTAVRFCVLSLWSDRGGTYSQICLLGLDDGTPFDQHELKLEETRGPHYTMLQHEPAELITLLRRDVCVPEQILESFRVWNNLPVNGHACCWHDFPAALRQVLPRLGWVQDDRGS